MLYIILLKEDISNTDNPSGQKLTQVVNWEFPVATDLRTVYCARARRIFIKEKEAGDMAFVRIALR